MGVGAGKVTSPITSFYKKSNFVVKCYCWRRDFLGVLLNFREGHKKSAGKV
jgi:hypothetical protein